MKTQPHHSSPRHHNHRTNPQRNLSERPSVCGLWSKNPKRKHGPAWITRVTSEYDITFVTLHMGSGILPRRPFLWNLSSVASYKVHVRMQGVPILHFKCMWGCRVSLFYISSACEDAGCPYFIFQVHVRMQSVPILYSKCMWGCRVSLFYISSACEDAGCPYFIFQVHVRMQGVPILYFKCMWGCRVSLFYISSACEDAGCPYFIFQVHVRMQGVPILLESRINY